MNLQEGPLLETLTRRLADTPPDFLAAPRIGKRGQVHVDAVITDLLVDLGGAPLSPEAAVIFQPKSGSADWLQLVLVAAWLLRDDWFRAQQRFAPQADAFVRSWLNELALEINAEEFIRDGDRREELARLALFGLGLRPAGESAAEAEDHLNALDSRERLRVIAAARQAEERTREVLRQMAAEKTRESADKWSRE